MVDRTGTIRSAVNLGGVRAGPGALNPGGHVGPGVAAERAGLGVGLQSGLDAVGIHALHIAAPVAVGGSHAERELQIRADVAARHHIREAVAGFGIEIETGQTVEPGTGFQLAEEALLVVVVGQGSHDFLSAVVGGAVVVAGHVAFQSAVAEGVADFSYQVGEEFLAHGVAEAGRGGIAQRAGGIPHHAVFAADALVNTAAEQVAVGQGPRGAHGGSAVFAQAVFHTHAAHLVIGGVGIQVYIAVAVGTGGSHGGGRCIACRGVGIVPGVGVVVADVAVLNGAIGNGGGQLCCQGGKHGGCGKKGASHHTHPFYPAPPSRASLKRVLILSPGCLFF